jgi:LmbE family N-acetylglucosaminyl deacetylase
VVSLTRGEHGPISDPRLASREGLPDVREAELESAARALGLDWSTCLRYPDGELPWVDHEAAAADLAALLAPRAPEVVLTFGEDGLYGHADHSAAAEIAAQAIRRLGAPVDIYEAAWPSGLLSGLAAAAAQRGLAHELWGLEPEAFGTDRIANVAIDVRTVMAQKLSALRAHRTQLGTDHLLTALPLDLAERFLGSEPWVGPWGGRLEELLGGG